MNPNFPSLYDVWRAQKRIQSIVQPTPLLHSSCLSEYVQSPVFLKLENMHPVGSFKVRGAANKILSLTPEQKEKGVTTFSTGNHGLAVAYIAQKLGIRAVICISHRVPEVKVQAIQRYGAKLITTGNSQDEAESYCNRLQKEQGLTIIPPFDDPDIIAGQGTIGLEIIDSIPDLGTVLIPLSGGGLLAGVSLALKSIHPIIRIAGVSMERSAVMLKSLQAGKPVILKEKDTLADSLLGGIGEDNQYTFHMVRKQMDEAIQLSEKEIASGMIFMLEHHRMLVEGAAATTVATILHKKTKADGKPIVLIISGNNVDLSVLLRLLACPKK